MVNRVTYRRQVTYNTRSNKIRKVKTPGGKLVALYYKKKTSPIKCGVNGQVLGGIKRMRASEMKKSKKRERTVSRAYGGCISGNAVRDRIIRAFLIEEVKIVKKVMQKKKIQKQETK